MRDHRPDVLEAVDLWKVFGPHPQRAREMAESGQSRSEILDATGCTIGVRNVSFSVVSGETFVVMGLSGSGKSTLIRCLARLSDPTSGQVMLGGEDFTAMAADQLRDIRRQKLSMVFQHFGLLPHRRVVDNVAYGLEIQRVPKEDRHARAQEVIDVVGLSGYESFYPEQLSGGMQQRVGLARALCVDPEILFFDEPFSALDPLIRRDMQDELLRLQNEMHRTLVFITHDFAEAIKLGDRIAIMKDGSLDQIGTAAELITNPATEYVREFTKDIPKAKVLTAADVMTPSSHSVGRSVSAKQSVESLVRAMLDDSADCDVVDEQNNIVGVVTRASVTSVLDA